MYDKDPERPIRHAATGMAPSMIANKISWFFDLTGPSVILDTACSASLNAFHIACQGLRNGDATMVIALLVSWRDATDYVQGLVGGINLFVTPDSMSPLAHLNFFGINGRCYSYDHRAKGYSRGEGFGILVIKPLSNALRDGDPIRAIIRGTGSNENGRTPGGITKVSFDAQRSLIRETYRSAGLGLEKTRYIEGHGPGTEGDVTESRALAAIFKQYRSAEDPLFVGSVKANLGHFEGGSGIASLVKVVLMLERGIIPKLANMERVNPQIEEDNWHLRVSSHPHAYWLRSRKFSFLSKIRPGQMGFGVLQSTLLGLGVQMLTQSLTTPTLLSLPIAYKVPTSGK